MGVEPQGASGSYTWGVVEGKTLGESPDNAQGPIDHGCSHERQTMAEGSCPTLN